MHIITICENILNVNLECGSTDNCLVCNVDYFTKIQTCENQCPAQAKPDYYNVCRICNSSGCPSCTIVAEGEFLCSSTQCDEYYGIDETGLCMHCGLTNICNSCTVISNMKIGVRHCVSECPSGLTPKDVFFNNKATTIYCVECDIPNCLHCRNDRYMCRICNDGYYPDYKVQGYNYKNNGNNCLLKKSLSNCLEFYEEFNVNYMDNRFGCKVCQFGYSRTWLGKCALNKSSNCTYKIKQYGVYHCTYECPVDTFPNEDNECMACQIENCAKCYKYNYGCEKCNYGTHSNDGKTCQLNNT
ncbi:hypothetical protein A3Q56_04840 [Intoshia linei]|uniref:Uncharacterized protein n=1 Tax=Intoshia linei TaxID=1819745 RepID=A0A177AZI6_9BILA|nr:hypothetical protein A3Q56_04840 [Intoshia linei]